MPCNAGERAVGGGGVAFNGVTNDFFMISSHPTVPGGLTVAGVPTGWRVEYGNADVGNNDTGDIAFYAYAVCAAP